MQISDAGLSLIKNFEGLSTKAYVCPAGVLSIGYGHTKNVKKVMSLQKQVLKSF